MRRIAVYGGRFSPFGNNHLDVVRYVAESGEFDHILLVPLAAHALKKAQYPFEHRYNMTVLGAEARHHAVPSFPEHVDISVSIAELHMLVEHSSPIHTIDLLRYLKREQASYGGEREYRFVIGPDIPDELHLWKSAEQIRSNFGFFEVPDLGMHVSQVRNMIQSRVATWNKHVPCSVATYIERHGLYAAA